MYKQAVFTGVGVLGALPNAAKSMPQPFKVGLNDFNTANRYAAFARKGNLITGPNGIKYDPSMLYSNPKINNNINPSPTNSPNLTSTRILQPGVRGALNPNIKQAALKLQPPIRNRSMLYLGKSIPKAIPEAAKTVKDVVTGIPGTVKDIVSAYPDALTGQFHTPEFEKAVANDNIQKMLKIIQFTLDQSTK